MFNLVLSLTVETRLKAIAQIAMDWEKNHIARKEKYSKYGKLYFIEILGSIYFKICYGSIFGEVYLSKDFCHTTGTLCSLLLIYVR